MKRFKLTAFIGIVLATVFTVSSAMAFDLVCRSEEMVANSSCDVAGVMRLIFDENDQTIIRGYLYGADNRKNALDIEHDYVLIRVTMSGTDVATNIVLPKLCKDIQDGAVGGFVDGIPVTIPHQADSPKGEGPVKLTEIDVEVSDTHADRAVGGVPDGTADITAYVWGEGSPSQNQSFEIYITEFHEMVGGWDNRNNWPWIRIGQNQSADAAIRNKTAICVNIAPEGDRPGFERNAKLIVSLNNEPKELSYTTSDHQIGHFYDSQIEQVACKGMQVGNIALGTGLQVGGTCRNFDNEDETGAGNAGYCVGTHFKNKLILQSTIGTLEAAGNYIINAQIYVNGKYGDRGVYFSNQPINIGNYGKLDDACGGLGTVNVGGGYKYLKADGITAAVPVAPVFNQCAIDEKNRATFLETPASKFITAGNSFLYIDWPSFNYDLTTVENIIKTEGSATVTIKYIIYDIPCGTLKNGDHEIGTFGCAAVRTCLYFPYVFIGQLPWQTGIAVSSINPAPTAQNIDDMEVVFTFHAADGKAYTYTKNDFTGPTWAGMMDTGFNFSTKPPAGVGWMEVSANFRVDGFQFVMNDIFGGTTQPRVLNRCGNYDGWK